MPEPRPSETSSGAFMADFAVYDPAARGFVTVRLPAIPCGCGGDWRCLACPGHGYRPARAKLARGTGA